MKRLGRRLGLSLVAVLVAASVVAADEPSTVPPAESSTTIDALQKRVDELTRQLELVKRQLEELKGQQEEEKREAELERLRRAATAEAAKAAPSGEIDTTTRFVSGTRMQPQLNPEISATGDLLFVGGDHQQEEFQAHHFELDIQSYLDPYARFHLVLGWHEHGHESTFGVTEEEEEHGASAAVGEAYVTWLNLPGSTSLTVGKKRQQFGVLNRWHLHALDQVDAPWVLQESFGEHGLSGTGLSFDWLMPRLWADTNELTVEVMNADNDVAFAGEDWQHPSFLARLKSYWDLSSDTYLELGLDALHGSADPGASLDHDFYAVDFALNWYPAGRELYRELTLRGMLLRSDLELDGMRTRETWGGYLYGQLKLSPHWITGVRWDRVDDQREEDHHYWGVTPYLTFWQSEFVRLRGQASYRDDNLFGTDRRFSLQLTVAAGPHKHDSY